MPRPTRAVTDANAEAGPSHASPYAATTGATFDFTTLDPSLTGFQSRAVNAAAPGEDDSDGEDDESFGVGSADEYSDADDHSIDNQNEQDGNSDHTDAEDEYRRQSGAYGSPALAATRSPSASSKGKQRAQDAPLARAARIAQPVGVETDQINRLILAMRGTSDFSVAGRTALDREFDRTIEQELEDIDQAIQGGKKSSTRRSRHEAEPSAEVKNMLNQANQLYARGGYDAAIEILEETIRIDPNLRVPWYTLASIYDARGELEKALMFKIIAAHLLPLSQAAVDWADLGDQSKELGLLQQAIYCYTQAIKGDKEDLDSMWDRAMLLKVAGEDKKAIKAFLGLLSVHPHDPGALRELCPLLLNTGQQSLAADLYLDAFEYYKRLCPEVNAQTEEMLDTFGYADLEFLADYSLAQQKWGQTAYVIRTGVRWLQGRYTESGWDMLKDDREFDLERKVRPNWQRDARYLEETPVYPLDHKLRLRLGLARLGMNDLEEAKASAATSELDVADYPEVYGAVADAYMDKKMYTDALEFLHELADCEVASLKLGNASWSVPTMKTRESVLKQVWPEILLSAGQGLIRSTTSVVKEQPDNYQCKMQLARAYEAINEPHKALDMLHEVIRDRQRLGVDLLEEQRARARARTGRTYATKEDRAELAAQREAAEQQRLQEFTLALAALGRIEADVENGDEDAIRDWLDLATYLVEAFRETKQFFPSDTTRKFTGVLQRTWKRRGGARDIDAQAKEMASRLQSSINPAPEHEEAEPETEAETFRGIHFDDWVGLILKYAFLLAKVNETEAAVHTLEHVQSANVFRQHLDRSTRIKLGLAAVHAYCEQFVEATDVLRIVFRPYQLRSEGLRLLYGLLSQGMKATQAFNATNLSKYMLRQLRALDTAVRGKADGRAGAPDGVEDAQEEGDEDHSHRQGSLFVPTKLSPTWNLAYGHVMLVSPSGTTALVYLLRAYELAPKQPLINLSLGVAYTMRAMSRQTDNRHHQLAQALAFFDQYRRLRGPCQEVEYNLGRFFHHLGLQSYAVNHYHNCLRMVEQERQAEHLSRMHVEEGGVEPAHVDNSHDNDESSDFARVAAYNLSSLYMLAGQDDLARMVSHKWLSM
ncbi:transcription factor TFIIIC subunit tfc4 [Microbotryomycetes sp. JL201]|nr:transcription factor TFIIIC subunit tfc4 [Microbotryomycetes sp. JL201]